MAGCGPRLDERWLVVPGGDEARIGGLRMAARPGMNSYGWEAEAVTGSPHSLLE
ncbi:MAG: hypothetical protein JRJ03_14785 [Deltaproteobacteria bacterium]|nr:hypothetical protein [Deltaproteobacteria bacterium]